MCRFSKGRWLVARDKECEDAQHRWIVGKLENEVTTSDVQVLVVKSDQEVKFDQEASIEDMNGELRSVGGSTSVKGVTGGCTCCERCDGEEHAGDAELRENDCCVHCVGVQYHV